MAETTIKFNCAAGHGIRQLRPSAVVITEYGDGTLAYLAKCDAAGCDFFEHRAIFDGIPRALHLAGCKVIKVRLEAPVIAAPISMDDRIELGAWLASIPTYERPVAA